MLSRSLSLHAVVAMAVVADEVKIAAGVVVVDGVEQQGREQVVGVAMAATHRVKRGRTRTRRDKEIMTEKEDTIERWAKQEGPVASR